MKKRLIIISTVLAVFLAGAVYNSSVNTLEEQIASDSRDSIASIYSIAIENPKDRDHILSQLSHEDLKLDSDYNTTNYGDKYIDGVDNGNFRFVGSGYVLTSNGYIITAGHVLNDPYKIYFVGLGNDLYKVKFSRTNKGRDIGLIKIEPIHALKPLELDTDDSITMGSVVFMISASRDGLSFKKGYVANKGSLKDMPLLEEGELDFLPLTSLTKLDITGGSGNSGAPILNKDGKVVGLVILKHRGREIIYSVNSKFVREAIMKLDPRLVHYLH